MAFTATQLITNAWYWSKLVARQFQVVSADQLTDGLYLLNFVLSALSQDDARNIPYYDHFTVTAIPGQEIYFIENLVDLEVLTYNLLNDSSNVRFSMERYGRNRYLGIDRVNNIRTLPYCYYTERVNGGMNVFIYFTPDKPYPLNFTGKMSIDTAAPNSDLLLILEQSYLDYLTIYLARYMRNFYGFDPLPALEMEFKVMDKRQRDLNAPDMSQHHVNLLPSQSFGDIYAFANLYRGFLPGQ